MPFNRKLLLCAVAVGLGVLFVRLGFWQLDRHGERSRTVRTHAERSGAPRLEWSGSGDVPPDTTGILGRRARLIGRWDRAGEVILRSRTQSGRAGAEVLTPFLVGGDASDGGGGRGFGSSGGSPGSLGPGGSGSPGRGDGTGGGVVMVLRGWLPAADGLRPDLATGWAGGEAGEPAEVEGVLVSSRNGRGGQPLWVDIAGRSHLALAALDLDQIRQQTGLNPSPHILRADDPPFGRALQPARAVETDIGPHLSYAIQWFSFAVIGLAGTAILVWRKG